ncbi:MAG: hypothetical protein Q4G58_13150 [bacterium]|nr:hypothetical protein [bacterium]
MKTKCLIVLAALLLIGAALLFYRNNSIKEDMIYSVSLLDMKTQKEKEENHFISRVDALNQAYTLFLEGLGINLRSSEITMYINLYKDAKNKDTYNWLVSWYNKETMESYSCTISASEDKVVNLFVVEERKLLSSSEEHKASYTQEEVLEVVQNFLNVLGKEVHQYRVVEVAPEYDYTDHYKKYFFSNEQEKTDRFYMEIDMNQKLIISYEIDPGDTK